jgi:hypothetical protein
MRCLDLVHIIPASIIALPVGCIDLRLSKSIVTAITNADGSARSAASLRKYVKTFQLSIDVDTIYKRIQQPREESLSIVAYQGSGSY